MNVDLATLIFAVGFGQLAVLVASALVPLRLNWREEFAPLKRLHRQMYWTYGGYVVLSIIALGLICLFNSHELASGSGLARSFCLYGRDILGHPPWSAASLRRERTPHHLVAASWLLHAQPALHGVHTPLCLGGALAATLARQTMTHPV